MEVGKTYKVTVEKILAKGVVVRLEDNTTEFIHLSNISSAFVDDPSKFLSVGDVYEAIGTEGKARPVELSLRHLNLNCKEAKPGVKVHRAESTFKPSKQSKQSKSLDEMIADAENDYRDKVKGYRSKNPEYSYSRSRRRSSKNY